MKKAYAICISLTIFWGLLETPIAAEICRGYGPQTPRDISNTEGLNKTTFTLAPNSSSMNLCNIHFHTNAEHKGPGFSVSAGSGKHGGYKCNETQNLSKSELEDTMQGNGPCKGLKAGDTVEVHWVHSTCNVKPGKGLGACLSVKCANPQLRVETQVFIAVNDKKALKFSDFAYIGSPENGFHQAKSIPSGTGTPIIFAGSTTGTSYNEQKCSPLQVTWSVRPRCARIDIASLHAWCVSNPFKEKYAHGVRQLVTAPELLAKIE